MELLLFVFTSMARVLLHHLLHHLLDVLHADGSIGGVSWSGDRRRQGWSWSQGRGTLAFIFGDELLQEIGHLTLHEFLYLISNVSSAS